MGQHVNTILKGYNISKGDCKKISLLLHELEKKINSQQKVTKSMYENRMYEIFGGYINAIERENVDYHFFEAIAKAYWEDGECENVFPIVYYKTSI